MTLYSQLEIPRVQYPGCARSRSRSFCSLFTLLFIIPFLWMIVLSLRSSGDILIDPYGLPLHAALVELLASSCSTPSIRFYQYFVNSIIVTGAALLITRLAFDAGGLRFRAAALQLPLARRAVCAPALLADAAAPGPLHTRST